MPPKQPIQPQGPENSDEIYKRIENVIKEVLGFKLSDISSTSEVQSGDVFKKVYILKFNLGSGNDNKFEKWLNFIAGTLEKRLGDNLSGVDFFILTQVIKRIRILGVIRNLFLTLSDSEIIDLYDESRNKINLTLLKEALISANLGGLLYKDLVETISYTFKDIRSFLDFATYLRNGIFNIPIIFTHEEASYKDDLEMEYRKAKVIENIGLNPTNMVSPAQIGEDYVIKIEGSSGRGVNEIPKMIDNIFSIGDDPRGIEFGDEIFYDSVFTRLIATVYSLHSRGISSGALLNSLQITSEYPGVITKENVIFQLGDSKSLESLTKDRRRFLINFAKDLADILAIIKKLKGQLKTPREKANCKKLIGFYLSRYEDYIGMIKKEFVKGSALTLIELGLDIDKVRTELEEMFE